MNEESHSFEIILHALKTEKLGLPGKAFPETATLSVEQTATAQLTRPLMRERER